jgi:hypothetical protein
VIRQRELSGSAFPALEWSLGCSAHPALILVTGFATPAEVRHAGHGGPTTCLARHRARCKGSDAGKLIASRFRAHVIKVHFVLKQRKLITEGASASGLPRIAQHFALNSLWRTQRAGNRNQEPFLVGGEEVQPGASVDDRPGVYLAFLGSVGSQPSSPLRRDPRPMR